MLVRFQFHKPPGKKSGTMFKLVIEISLAALLVLPLPTFAAQSGRTGGGQAAEQRGESLRALAEQVRLGRSVVEFAEEFSLFDSQLYGALPDKSSNRESILQLNEEIRSTNSRLGQALNKMDLVVNGIDGAFSGDREVTEQEVAAEVRQLENELAAMNGRMGELNNQVLLEGESELLDGTLWDELLVAGGTRDLLEMIDESLEAEALATDGESSAPEGNK